MGGVGKTELAIQYAKDPFAEKTYPGGICWLSARNQDIATDIVKFAKINCGLSIPEFKDVHDQVRFCYQNWPAAGDVLIVLDDMTKYEAVEPYLPHSDSRFKLLITTRLELGSSFTKFPLGELEEDGAIALLKSLVDCDRIQSQIEEVKSLCKRVGYLPLGLELLGRFLARKPDWTVSRLIEKLASESLAAEALRKTEDGMTAQQGVDEALELSWQELNEAEQELACVLGMFAIAPIPWSLVEQCIVAYKVSFLPKVIDLFAGNQNRQRVILDDLNIEEIRDRGLVDRNLLKWAGENIYQMHQVIQEYFRIKLYQLPNQGQSIKVNFLQSNGKDCKDY
jgi:NB-ARC domain